MSCPSACPPRGRPQKPDFQNAALGIKQEVTVLFNQMRAPSSGHSGLSPLGLGPLEVSHARTLWAGHMLDIMGDPQVPFQHPLTSPELVFLQPSQGVGVSHPGTWNSHLLTQRGDRAVSWGLQVGSCWRAWLRKDTHPWPF